MPRGHLQDIPGQPRPLRPEDLGQGQVAGTGTYQTILEIVDQALSRYGFQA
ncbi:MAG: hypothetical protein AAB254_11270 [candidate division NC10 bacterium]